uniref:Uncharacterized protein n=1 Tax=Siphoviridae sp. ctLqe90 TaxID=2825456 RepID=A0A8S5Q2I9_9CAUD|nr:MAG TPA: hypothetical protein [Siphoviridae sp. ctLqe90]
MTLIIIQKLQLVLVVNAEEKLEPRLLSGVVTQSAILIVPLVVLL